MTDEELIARLREIQGQAGLFASAAADRVEALVKEAVLSKAAYEGVSSLLLSVQQDCIKERQRAERLEAALTWQVEQPEAHPFMVAHALAALKGNDQ